MDNKYGQLYTHGDLTSIVDTVVNMKADGGSTDDLVNKVVESFDKEGALTFPIDEPTFLMRAKDKRAAGAVRNYRLMCGADGSKKITQKFLDQLDVAVRHFERFRIDHAERMKHPD